jgi:hypothetical protein
MNFFDFGEATGQADFLLGAVKIYECNQYVTIFIKKAAILKQRAPA